MTAAGVVLAALLACPAGAGAPSPAPVAPAPPSALAMPAGIALISVPGTRLQVSATEVTNASFRVFRPEHTSNRAFREHYIEAGLDLDGDPQPAIVTWLEASAFTVWASEQNGLTVRLPTEAEWELVARAGTTSRFSWGDDPTLAHRYANLAGPATYDLVVRGDPAYPQDDLADRDDGFVGTAPVGSFQPNPWGLYDVHGNATEWVQDAWSAELEGSRVHRGGAWNHGPGLAGSATRNYCFQGQHYDVTGFRVIVER